MRFFFIIFFSLMVKDVFSLRGLYSAEVSILGEGEVSSDTKPQVTCTISTIEPAGMDVKFVKYIASSEEVAAKFSSWRDNYTAQTFEECADAAAFSGSKMFLFDEQRCQISDDVHERSDYCTKDHSQVVYMDANAETSTYPDIATVPDTSTDPNIPTVPDNPTDRGLFCNCDWTISCTSGRCINNLVMKKGRCAGGGVYILSTIEGRYHLIGSDYKVRMKDHYAECEKYGTQPCAPANASSILEFANHLEADLPEYEFYPAIGLNSTDGGMSYMWAGGVPMPKKHKSWQALWNRDKMCGFISGSGIMTWDCNSMEPFCCMLPYYAN